MHDMFDDLVYFNIIQAKTESIEESLTSETSCAIITNPLWNVDYFATFIA